MGRTPALISQSSGGPPPTLLSRYRPEHLAMFSEEEKRRFLAGVDPAVVAAAGSDEEAWSTVAEALGWELLYRVEPQLYHRLVAGEKIHPGILEWLPERIGNAVELGAGTGRLTVELAPRCDWLIAVEPAEPMRKILRQTLADEKIGGVRVVEGYFDEIPVTDGWADLVVSCGSFTPDSAHGGEPALKEMQRVCSPGGQIVVISPAQGSWLAQHGFKAVAFPGEAILEYSSPQEAAEIARIFFPSQAEGIIRSGSSKIPCDVTGCDPPHILYFSKPGS
ncbi:MAG: class I SAM-dependent methyltransferase [Actinomycetota bacterium]